MGRSIPENTAAKLLHRYRFGAPEEIDVEEIAALCGASVRTCSLAGAEARLVRYKERSFISVSDRVILPARRRFAIAHEVGHLQLHHASNNLVICTSEDLAASGFERSGLPVKEVEANAFAAELLLPEFMVVPLIKFKSPSLELLSSIATRFSTSLTATARRFALLTEERCAVVFSEAGRIRSVTRSEDFGFWIPVGTELSPLSLAYDFFRGKGISQTSESVDASAWLDGDCVEDALIKEQSIKFGAYDVVLTLLWIDDPIDLEED